MEENKEQIENVINPDIFRSEYDNLFDSNERWNKIETPDEPLFNWDEDSTYIQNPPFFEDLSPEPEEIKPLSGLRVLASFGDTIITDHISPAGAIAVNSTAEANLQEQASRPRQISASGSSRISC